MADIFGARSASRRFDLPGRALPERSRPSNGGGRADNHAGDDGVNRKVKGAAIEPSALLTGRKALWEDASHRHAAITIATERRSMSSDPSSPGSTFPLALAAVALLTCALVLPSALSLEFDGSLRTLLPQRDASRILGSSRPSVFRSADIILSHRDKDGSAHGDIERLAAALRRLDGVKAATTWIDPNRTGGMPAHLETAIHVDIRNARSVEASDEIERRIRIETAKLGLAGSFDFGGPSVVRTRITRQLEAAAVTFSIASWAIAIVAAVLSLRSLSGVLLAILCLGVAVVWAVAAIAATGRPITLTTVGILPLLPLIGVAFPLYVLTRIQNAHDQPVEGEGAVARVFGAVRLRLGVLAGAAALGALVHLFSDFPALRDFGLFVSLGIACIVLSTLTIVPIGVTGWLRPKGPAVTDETAERHSRRIERLGAVAVRRGWALATIAAVLSIVGALGVWRFVDTSEFRFLVSADTRPSLESADLQTWHVRVGGREPNSINRVDTLLAIADLQRFISSQKGVLSTHSLIDFFTGVEALDSDDLLPRSQEEIDTILAGDSERIAHVVNADFSITRIMVETSGLGTEEFNTLRGRIEAFSRPSGWSRLLGRRARFPPGVGVTAKGELVELHRRADLLKAEIVRSLAVTSALLLAVVSIQFLSGRIGFLVVFLNLLAMIVMIGVSSWSGLGHSTVTAALPSLLLGLAVGHTAFYFRALGADGRTLDCPTEALARIVQSAGRPLVYSIAVLFFGFCAMTASELPALRWFGALASIGILLAFVANLLLLSSRVLNARIITMADFLSTRLGAIEEIPLFAGMRPFQAKLVVLSGRLATVEPGTAIARQGEYSSELYLLLDGRAEVRQGSDGAVVGTMQRGDVVGEMGLVRSAPRSADVVAIESLEYLILDGDLLQRLRRQYPRTAAVLLYNLTRILSDRLDRATERITALQAGA